jgi:hypothetical protein
MAASILPRGKGTERGDDGDPSPPGLERPPPRASGRGSPPSSVNACRHSKLYGSFEPWSRFYTVVQKRRAVVRCGIEPRFQRFCDSVGARVRALRLKCHLTQEDMMDYGFDIRHYQRIEAGRSVTLWTVWKLAQAFKVSPRRILPPGDSPIERRGPPVSKRRGGPKAATGSPRSPRRRP